MADQPAGTATDQGLGFDIDKVELPKDEADDSAEGGFLHFVMRGNVVDLAVAVIIGAAFVAIVNAFVKDLLTPLIAAIGGRPDFSALTFTIHGSRFLYGDFINSVIAFLIVAAVLYYVVIAPMNRIMRRVRRPRPAEPPMKACPECLNLVPAAARRCGYCTSSLMDTAA
jgi:large conductance mechanosensitive channel